MTMFVKENVSLKDYSTMRLGGNAAYVVEIHDREEIREVNTWLKNKNLAMIVIGEGSNVVWRDEGFYGLVVVNKIPGYEVISEDENDLYIKVGAGENWDKTVETALASQKSGIEYLSYIPGTVGGAPVQNIGAYGHELSESLVSVEAYDLADEQFVLLPKHECEFGYRTSRFKFGPDKNRFIIASITLHLSNPAPHTSYYHLLREYFETNKIMNPTPLDIRKAVIEIRMERLPDPLAVPNTGSFFANPIISKEKYQELLIEHPRLTSWPSPCFWEQSDGTYKVAAGALLEYTGYKDFHDPESGMGTWKHQALVIINEKARSTQDLINFVEKIKTKVRQTFGITLEQEPELLP